MADIKTLRTVCDTIDAQLDAIYRYKVNYNIDDDEPNFGLSNENLAAYHALHELRLHLEKAIESEIDAMEMGYGE